MPLIKKKFNYSGPKFGLAIILRCNCAFGQRPLFQVLRTVTEEVYN